MTKLVQHEQTKLLATGLSNLGIATVVAGAIGALIAKSYGAANADALCYRGFRHLCILVRGVPDVYRSASAQGSRRMTMNDFLLWLIPPIVFVAGGALAAYLSHRQHD